MGDCARIFAIEDDLDFVQLLRQILLDPSTQPPAFAFDHAPSLGEGLEALRSRGGDAVLLDLNLPDSQGIETYRRLSARFPALAVVVLTALGDESMAAQAMAGGAEDFLPKMGLGPAVLRRTLRYAIQRRKLLNQTKRIILAAADGMAVVCSEGRTRFVNPAAEAILGRRSEELVGRPFPHPVDPGERRLIEIRPAGAAQTRTIDMRVVAIEWEGAPASLACLRDVTEIRRAEAEEWRKTDQLKDEFIATVSHELRSPLTVVAGAIDSIKSGSGGALSQVQAHMIEMAHRNLSRLCRVINDLLDLSRLESRSVQIRRRRVELGTLIAELGESYRVQAAERGLLLEALPQSGLPALEADPDLLARVLVNLLDNAIRYARSKIEVRTEFNGPVPAPAPAPPGTPEISIIVANDGPEIPKERLPDLFKKFSQIGPPGVGPYKGLGLGLALCREIVELHGGRIWAARGPGGGAEFHVVLPVAAPPASPPPPGG